MPIILATQEAEIRRITVQSQPGQMVCETLSRKNPSQKNKPNQTKTKKAGGVPQDIGPEFKPQYHKQNKTKQTTLHLLCGNS
jgi:hypothetical protein